jgi:hypothetical protein
MVIVCCVLRAHACYHLCGVCFVLFPVWCVLRIVSCVVCAAYCFLCGVWRVLFPVRCVLCMFCVLFHVLLDASCVLSASCAESNLCCTLDSLCKWFSFDMTFGYISLVLFSFCFMLTWTCRTCAQVICFSIADVMMRSFALGALQKFQMGVFTSPWTASSFTTNSNCIKIIIL